MVGSKIVHRDPVWSEVAKIWHVREKAMVDGRNALNPARINEIDKYLCSPILVVGGGAGLIPICLAKMGHEITAIDSAWEMVRLARDRSKKENLRIAFHRVDGKDANFGAGAFNTILLNSGVTTQVTLSDTTTDDILTRSHKQLSADGRIVVAYCRETQSNQGLRDIHQVLGLTRIPSNNRFFLGTDSLARAEQRFLQCGDVDVEAAKRLFAQQHELIERQHRMVRAVEAELMRQGMDAESFISDYYAFERPFLNAEDEALLRKKVAEHFVDVSGALLSDDDTAIVSARKQGGARP